MKKKIRILDFYLMVFVYYYLMKMMDRELKILKTQHLSLVQLKKSVLLEDMVVNKYSCNPLMRSCKLVYNK